MLLSDPGRIMQCILNDDWGIECYSVLFGLPLVVLLTVISVFLFVWFRLTVRRKQRLLLRGEPFFRQRKHAHTHTHTDRLTFVDIYRQL
jgi:hypothetical protein